MTRHFGRDAKETGAILEEIGSTGEEQSCSYIREPTSSGICGHEPAREEKVTSPARPIRSAHPDMRLLASDQSAPSKSLIGFSLRNTIE
jgi:hypothetical protein